MNKYKKLIDQASQTGLHLLLPEAKAQLEELKAGALRTLENGKYIKIPLVGLFNAGKTTLVNALIGQPGLLPVNIIPTTAIPCEIYPVTPGATPYAVVTRGEQKIYEGPIEGYDSCPKQPGDMGRVYVDSDFVRRLEARGIVIVDMPGSDSGIKEHNDAIIRYVEQGTIFALLTDAKNGSLNSADIAFIEELGKYGLMTVIFISKTDLIGAASLQDVRELIAEQAAGAAAKPDVKAISVANGDTAAFTDWVEGINVTEINDRRFYPVVREYVTALRNALVMRRDILGNSSSFGDIDAKIRQLEGDLVEIKQKLDGRIESADSLEKSTQDILDWVENDMRANSRLVAEAILSNNSTQVNETIMSIVRPALMKAFAEERRQFVEAMQAELDSITKRMLENIEIPANVIGDLIDANSEIIIGGVRALAERLTLSGNPWAVLAGTVLRIIAEWIPDLLRSIFGGQERAITRIEQKFMGPFTSQILGSLRPKVRDMVKTQQDRILEDAQKKYADQVAQIQESLRQLHEERKKGEADYANSIATLTEAVDQLDRLNGSIQ